MTNPVILHLAATSHGGAYDYTYNIHQNLLNGGYRSYLAIIDKIFTPVGEEITIEDYYPPLYERLKNSLHEYVVRKYRPGIDSKYSGYNLKERIKLYNSELLFNALPEKPNYIFIHWVSGYANAKFVRELQKLTGAEVYHFMIDEAILSGGCHYPWNCNGYQRGCRNCAMTNSKIMQFFIHHNYLYKKHYISRDKNVIYPTTFDYNRLSKSPLWRGATAYKLIEAIDENLFAPIAEKEELKIFFHIPPEKKVVFFGCTSLDEPRKGMALLIDAINMINRDDIVFLAAGSNALHFNKDVIYAGYLDKETLAKAYQLADVFVCPSLEDSGPQMINMSIMSGTPAVAFETGVALDIIFTGQTGYRAKYNNAEDLAKGINYILDLPKEKYNQLKKDCRAFALNNFSTKSQLQFFKKLFNSEK